MSPPAVHAALQADAIAREVAERCEEAERQERASWAQRREDVLRVLSTLRGRRDMNARTAETHPEASVRVRAAARAEAYGMAILDVTSLVDEARR